MRPNPADDDRRACRDVPVDVFFPDPSDITGGRQVIATYCAKCPIVDACLEWALEIEGATGHSGRNGIYGGMTPSARWKVYNERRKAGQKPPPKAIKHGTAAGYTTHRRRGEKACQACTEAQNQASLIRQARAREGAA